MAPKQPPVILPPNLTPATLIPIQQLLHLLVHRNKNQHRITKWWSQLQLLRRALSRLIVELESPEAGFRKNKEIILERCRGMREQVIPRAYLAFSGVVADNQYASLGLMLMGCLARVDATIGWPRGREEAGEEEDGEVEVKRTVVPSEDFGEAITREEELMKEVVEESKAGKMVKNKRRVLDVDEKAFDEEEPTRAATKTSKKPLREAADVSDEDSDERLTPRKKAKKDTKQPEKLSDLDDIFGSTSKKLKKTAKKIPKRAVTEVEEIHSDQEADEQPVPKKPKVSKAAEGSSDLDDIFKATSKKANESIKKASSKVAAKPVKKKKKKGGDAFDDLFSGLV